MKTTRTFLLGIACLAVVGCTKEAGLPELVPVSGTVTLDGKPVSGANVTFMPSGTTRGSGADGRTDAEGVYQLRARHGGAGAAVGTYKVTVSKLAKPDGSEVTPGDATPPALSGAREMLPAQYTNLSQTTLKPTVPAGGGVCNLELITLKKR